MSSIHELIINRRSIRRYTDQKLSAEDVKLIVEAGLMAPTSKSARDWQFVLVDDTDKLEKLSQCKPLGANPIAKCALAIVIASDPTKSDPWIEDASVAASYMQLQAADLGIGSCWIQVRGRFTADNTPSEEYVQELLGMPDTLPVTCILTFGYPAEERKPQNTDKLLWENVHIDSWKPQD